MRLLVVNWFDWTHPLWGGAEVYLREVSRRLVARGHDVTLLCSTYAGCERESVIDGIRILRRGGFWTFHLQAPWYYRRELAGERFDCVFEYTNKTPLFTPLYVRTPLIAVAHHLFGTSIFRESWPPVAAYIYTMERLMPPAYGRVPWIAVSASTRRELLDRGIPAANVHVIPNGVDASFFAPAPASTLDSRPSTLGPRQTLPAGRFVVAWIGRMRRYKRVDVLLRAMPALRERVPGARLELAGDGPQAPALRALAARLGLGDDAIRFLGGVSEAAKLALLRRAHVLAQPSVKEGWGLTVVEAGACGVPAVAADVPGLRDSVLSGETGLLVPSGDARALAGALASLWHDPARRAAMGAAARTFAQRFTWDAAADATEHLAFAVRVADLPNAVEATAAPSV